MLRPSAPDLKVYLHRAPIDMRAGRNGLATLAREVMQKDPFGNSCFLFTNKRYTALKILAWDSREPREVCMASPVPGGRSRAHQRTAALADGRIRRLGTPA